MLGAAHAEGIAELDAGLGVETTPEELMDEVSAELGLEWMGLTQPCSQMPERTGHTMLRSSRKSER